MTNLLEPLRRDRKLDFAYGEGAALLASKIRQVLMTKCSSPQGCGELPWRTDFGSKLHLLRHGSGVEVMVELARVYVKEALRRWLPEVELSAIEAISQGGALYLRIRLSSRTFEPTLLDIPMTDEVDQ